MEYVGVRELKNDASEVIRAVRERQAKYVVTYHGRPVAVILPVDPTLNNPDLEPQLEEPDYAAYWVKMDRLRAEINAKWKSEKSAVELVDEQRR